MGLFSRRQAASSIVSTLIETTSADASSARTSSRQRSEPLVRTAVGTPSAATARIASPRCTSRVGSPSGTNVAWSTGCPTARHSARRAATGPTTSSRERYAARSRRAWSVAPTWQYAQA